MRKLNRIVLLFVGIILASIFLELFMRATSIPLPDFSDGIYDFPCYRASDVSWIALKQNATCTLHSKISAFPDSIIKTNSFGLRNGDIQIQKRPGSTRLLFIGDSFTFGFGVKESESFPSLIQKYLSSAVPNTPIEVINAGMPAVGSGRYYLRYHTAPYANDADIIVIALYVYNDFIDSEIKPHWIDVNGDHLPDRITTDQAHIDYKGNLVSNYRPAFLEIPILNDSRLLKLTWLAWNRIATNGNKPVTPLIPDALCVYMSDCAKAGTAFAERQKLFLTMKQLTQSRNQKILFVMIPAEFQVYDDTRLVKYHIPIALSPDEKERPEKIMGTYFQENNIPYVDLLPILKEWRGEHPYFTLDEHFNAAGHQITADALFPVIKSWITASASATPSE